MEEVNEFLKDLEQNKLIDIKYSMVVKGNEIFYSAMMMYEEDENNDNENLDTFEWSAIFHQIENILCNRSIYSYTM